MECSTERIEEADLKNILWIHENSCFHFDFALFLFIYFDIIHTISTRLNFKTYDDARDVFYSRR